MLWPSQKAGRDPVPAGCPENAYYAYWRDSGRTAMTRGCSKLRKPRLGQQKLADDALQGIESRPGEALNKPFVNIG